MSRIPLFPVFRVVVVATCGILVALAARPRTQPAVLDAAPTPLWATDIEAGRLGGLPFGEAAKPLQGQKRPPCARGVEVEHAGACWIPHELRPPCPPGLYEGAGKCLVPVKASTPPPVSLRGAP